MIENREDQLITKIGKQLHKAMIDKEEEIDLELEKLNNLSEDDFEKIRYNRRQELIRKSKTRNCWLALGHGGIIQSTSVIDFFDHIKKSPKVVCLFYKPDVNLEYNELMLKNFEILSKKIVDICFITVNVENHEFICVRLNIYVVPSILIIKEMQAIHLIRGFDEFENGAKANPKDFEKLFKQYNMNEEFDPSWYSEREEIIYDENKNNA